MKKNFQENEKDLSSFDERIAQICDGLIYISETDAPLTPFQSDAPKELNAVAIAEIASVDASPVEMVSADAWFARLVEEKDWWGTDEKDIAKRFARLNALLEEHLRDLLVFRFGRIQIDIFIVGTDPDGHIVGVRTHAVET